MKKIVMDEKYQKFFDEHTNFFDSNIKKAAFLQGVLCQNLLDVQWDTKKATPFINRLNGLKLNERIIKRLLPEIIAKLEEYNCNFYRKLETTISELHINSEFKLSNDSNDEMSYYFTLGMRLNKMFKSEKERKMNEIRVQENEELFDEIMKHCVVDMNIDCWDYSSDSQSRHLQWTLIDKKTGHHVGWLVDKSWTTYHIKIKEDSLHKLLKQDK